MQLEGLYRIFFNRSDMEPHIARAIGRGELNPETRRYFPIIIDNQSRAPLAAVSSLNTASSSSSDSNPPKPYFKLPTSTILIPKKRTASFVENFVPFKPAVADRVFTFSTSSKDTALQSNHVHAAKSIPVTISVANQDVPLNPTDKSTTVVKEAAVPVKKGQSKISGFFKAPILSPFFGNRDPIYRDPIGISSVHLGKAHLLGKPKILGLKK
jgi:hypothetical protein